MTIPQAKTQTTAAVVKAPAASNATSAAKGPAPSKVTASKPIAAKLSPEEVDARLEQLAAEHGLEGELDDEEIAEAAEPDDAAADGDAAQPAEDAGEAVAEEEDEVTFGSLLGELFGPMDGFFILLAFFTAYKVGSGEIGD